MPDEEEQVGYPAPVGLPVEAEAEEEKDELADLFEVPQPEDNDMVTDHLLDIDEDDDLSDLTSVSQEDVMGTPLGESKKRYRVVPRRVNAPPPPTSLGGIGY